MNKLSDKVWQNPAYFIAFGFGSGLSPVAPGTCGTLAAIPVYFLLSYCSWPIYLILTCLAFALGVMISDIVCKDLGEHDYAGIVWDEFVGSFLPMFLIPRSLLWMVLGFILFRIFQRV